MKKLLILLLCLTLALPAYAQEPDRAPIVQEWHRLLTYYETAHTAQAWALDYAAQYLSTCTWKDLLMARLAASSAYTVLLNQEIPAVSLSSTHYAPWMQLGHDLTFIPIEFAYLSQHHTEAVAAMANLMACLQHNVFWQPQHNTLQQWVTRQQEMLATERAMMCNTTNALSLSAPEALRTQEQQGYAAACPTLFAEYSLWQEDMDNLEKDQSALYDRMEAHASGLAASIGQTTIYGDLLASLVEKGDDAAIRQHAVTITGLPSCLPEPPWANPDVEYLWTDENGKRWCAMPGEALDNHAITQELVWYGISRSAFDAYAKQLVLSGLGIITDEASSAQRKLYLRAGDSLVALVWTEQYVLFLSPDPTVCIVPAWFMK